MNQREKAKKDSLDALARIAYAVGGGNPAPAKAPVPAKSTLPKPAAKPAPPPAPKPVETDFDRKRNAQRNDRKAKLEEERALKARRENELAGSTNLAWRGQWTGGSMPGVRRTAFERDEPSLAEKIHGVLGDPAQKEGRAKNREKSSRQSGR